MESFEGKRWIRERNYLKGIKFQNNIVAFKGFYHPNTSGAFWVKFRKIGR